MGLDPPAAKNPMIIRECLASDAAAVDTLFQEFVAYLRSIGDESDYRFGAQQYLTDGFGADPAFRGFVAEDASGLIGYVLYSRTYDGDYVRNFYVVDLYVQEASRGHSVGRLCPTVVSRWAIRDYAQRNVGTIPSSDISWITQVRL